MEKENLVENENKVNFDSCIPCFGKAIVDAKDIYTDYLLNILTPLIYEGLYSLYIQARKYNKQAEEKEKKNSAFKNPGIKYFFQELLNLFKDMNVINTEEEALRIKNNCGCAEIFDDLIKAVIKSHISVLTCTVKDSKLIKDNKIHESINIAGFIHKCYVESIKFIYEMPELFDSGKKNQQIILYYIKLGIKNAIKNILPMRQILEEFLNSNYDAVIESQIEKIQNIVIESIKKEKEKEKEKDNGIFIKHESLLEESEKNNANTYDNYEFDINEFLVKNVKNNSLLSSEKPQVFETKIEIKSEDKNIIKSEDKKEIKSEDKNIIKSENKNIIKSEDKKEIKSEDKNVIKSENKNVIKSEDKKEIKSEDKKIIKSEDKKNKSEEQKKIVDLNEMFGTVKGRGKNDDILFDQIEKFNEKRKISEKLQNLAKSSEKKDDDIRELKIDKKIRESENGFYENATQ
jgi:hypothetical protein